MFQWCVLSSRKLRQQFCRLTHVGHRYFAFRNEFLGSRYRSLKGGWNPITKYKSKFTMSRFRSLLRKQGFSMLQQMQNIYVSGYHSKCRVFVQQVQNIYFWSKCSKCRISMFQLPTAHAKYRRHLETNPEYLRVSLPQQMQSIGTARVQNIYFWSSYSKCITSMFQPPAANTKYLCYPDTTQ